MRYLYICCLLGLFIFCGCRKATPNENEQPSTDTVNTDSDIISCESFIKMGKKYIFNNAEVADNSTEPATIKKYDSAYAIFNDNTLTICVGRITEQYDIVSASYHKSLANLDWRHADLHLSKKNQAYAAKFWINDMNIVQGLSISESTNGNSAIANYISMGSPKYTFLLIQ